MAMGVTGEFPEEGPYYDVITPTDRDMHLRPDPSTVRIVPWATDPTAQVIHDCYDRDGKLMPFAPRSVLRRVCDLFDAEGWEPVVAPGAGVLPGRAQHRPRHAAEAAGGPQRPRVKRRARPIRSTRSTSSTRCSKTSTPTAKRWS